MSNFGLPELLVILPMAVFAALPIATFVFVLKTHQRLARVEQLLAQRPAPPSTE
jgi:hypothetical protein